jgi:anti-sigma factor RsiW
MFDWSTELEEAKRRVAELEDMVSRLRDALRQSADNPMAATPVERILDRARRTLPVRMANLERARHHQRFI